MVIFLISMAKLLFSVTNQQDGINSSCRPVYFCRDIHFTQLVWMLFRALDLFIFMIFKTIFASRSVFIHTHTIIYNVILFFTL
jgi:hypothetical protein